MITATHTGKRLIRADLQFQRSNSYHHSREHGGIKADVLLETELRGLYLD